MRGRVIAEKYRLEREIGRGGMGAVWEAFDLLLHRHVALKLVVPQHSGSAKFKLYFEREAKALARVRNNHIVAIHDYGFDDESPYMVMEYLVGEDLDTRLKRVNRLSPAATLALLQQIASGLSAAAAVDLVHRDLKPANIFLAKTEDSEEVKILDFGLAWSQVLRVERAANSLVGTPAFMSPEQIRGLMPHHVGDLWSLAVIAYLALTGTLPFPQRTFSELVVAVCTDPVTPLTVHVPELPSSIDEFFERALAKDTAQRYQTAQEFVLAFAKLCSDNKATKILFVDDEPDLVRMIKMRFRKKIRDSVYEMTFADGGATALEALRRDPDVDLILSDINMPGMNGLTLLERIPEIAPLAKVVMVSAYGDMDNIRRAMNAGAFDFVVKPIDFADLEATIEKCARHTAELRKLASSDVENLALRKFTSEAVRVHFGSSGIGAPFPSEQLEASVCVVELDLQTSADPSRPARELIRSLNANFEVIIPELQARGGVIDRLDGDSLVALFSGDGHLDRALVACAAIAEQAHALSQVAGTESPYASGLRTGVATGTLVAGLVGSHVCERLAFTMVGGATIEAARLAHAARPSEILVSDVAQQTRFVTTEVGERTLTPGAEPVRVHSLCWGNEAEQLRTSMPDATTPTLDHATEPTLADGSRLSTLLDRSRESVVLRDVAHHPYRGSSPSRP